MIIGTLAVLADLRAFTESNHDFHRDQPTDIVFQPPIILQDPCIAVEQFQEVDRRADAVDSHRKEP